MTLKSGIYFLYISFCFEHDNLKFMKQNRINKKKTFICFNQKQCFYMIFLLELISFTMINKQVLILMCLIVMDVLRDVVLNMGG